MSDRMMATTELAERIRVAFAGTPYPGDEAIAAPLPEARELRDDLVGRDWRDVDSTIAYSHFEMLSVLTPEGLRYFLPAFMLAALPDSEEADWIGNGVVSVLSVPAPDDGPGRAAFESFARLLRPAQVDAIVSFLHYVDERERRQDGGEWSDETSAAQGLKGYWEKP